MCPLLLYCHMMQAARQLSDEDLILLLRQPEGSARSTVARCAYAESKSLSGEVGITAMRQCLPWRPV